MKSLLIGKDLDAGKDCRQEEEGMTEDKMVGWHHWLNGQKFEQTLGDGQGQGSLACYSPWGRKESGTTEQLNKNIVPRGFLRLHFLTRIQQINLYMPGDFCFGGSGCLFLNMAQSTLLTSWWAFYYSKNYLFQFGICRAIIYPIF